MKRVIYNAQILTMNAAMETIPNGSILVEDGRISSVTAGRLEAEGAEMTDAGGMIAMPGFVNTHTHVPMSMFKGLADDLPLQEWLTGHIFPAEARWITPGNVRTASRLSFIEMIKSGTTCFNDMYFFEEVIAEEAARAGLRGLVGESLCDFPTPSYRTVGEGLARSREIIRQCRDNALVRPTVCLHSPYTCCTETLEAGRALAEETGARLHIHVAETRKECTDMKARNGMTPAAYLDSIGILGRDTVAAHCVWLEPEDIRLLADKGVSVAHCPKSNLKLASGIADSCTYGRQGINVALGTDGSASNNSLDMVEEMRMAALLPKVVHGDAAALDARTALRMATINGAKALGLEKECGSLEPGKCADLILIHADSSNMMPVYDPYSSVVYAMNAKNVRSSMVNGEWLMKDRRLCRMDKDSCLEDMGRLAEAIRKNQ